MKFWPLARRPYQREAEEIAEAVYVALREHAPDQRIVIINNLQINFALGGGATVQVKN